MVEEEHVEEKQGEKKKGRKVDIFQEHGNSEKVSHNHTTNQTEEEKEEE